jgi:pyoverdine/dityrosine biosynthesis protein Dit1
LSLYHYSRFSQYAKKLEPEKINVLFSNAGFASSLISLDFQLISSYSVLLPIISKFPNLEKLKIRVFNLKSLEEFQKLKDEKTFFPKLKSLTIIVYETMEKDIITNIEKIRCMLDKCWYLQCVKKMVEC